MARMVTWGALAAGLAMSAGAQGISGTLGGLVTDVDGNRLDRASIVIVNGHDGVVTRVRTGPNGRYEVMGAPQGGPYRVVAQAVGFTTQVRDSLMLEGGKTLLINFQLVAEPGRAASTETATPVEHATLSLSSNTLDAAAIATVPGSSALDAIEHLRPGMLRPDIRGCQRADSMALFVNGSRRPAVDPMPDESVLRRVQQDTTGGQLDKVLRRADSAMTEAMGEQRTRRQRQLGVNSSLFYAREELARIRASDVALIRYVGCEEIDMESHRHNVIWIELKGYRYGTKDR